MALPSPWFLHDISNRSYRFEVIFRKINNPLILALKAQFILIITEFLSSPLLYRNK